VTQRLVPVAQEPTIWDKVFTVAPLVLVGSKEPDGTYDLAPKHLAFPLGWQDRYCFVCSPRHSTQRNIEATGQFTVSYPRAEQVVLLGQAAAPRAEDGHKYALDVLPTMPATTVDGVLVEGGYLHLECELERIVDGFGDHTLIVGNIVAALADPLALRGHDRDDADIVHNTPLLAYVSPARFGVIGHSFSFPFPDHFRR